MFKKSSEWLVSQAKDRSYGNSLMNIIDSLLVQTLWSLKFDCQSHVGDDQLWSSHRLLVICGPADSIWLTLGSRSGPHHSSTKAHLEDILIPPVALKNPLGILASQGYSNTHLIERSGNIWSGLSLNPCHMLLKKISLKGGTFSATVIYEWSSFLV